MLNIENTTEGVCLPFEVRAVFPDGTTEVMPTAVALGKAQAMGLNLILITPMAIPPVAKVMNYEQWLDDNRRKIAVVQEELSGTADRKAWVHPRYPFFLPVKPLSRVFSGKFVGGLKRLYRRRKLDCSGPATSLTDPQQFARLLRSVHRQDWVVYAKPAFGGPSQVLRYLGRYTHRVAISNHRSVAFDGERVTFRYKDYAHGGKHRVMTLTAVEFLRRFFLHVLPKGFVRIRHIGYLANRWRSARLAILS
jgi:hypothetical protein